MSLSVPAVSTLTTSAAATHFPGRAIATQTPSTLANTPTMDATLTGFDIKFDPSRQEIIFEDELSCPVRNGDWIVILVTGKLEYMNAMMETDVK